MDLQPHRVKLPTDNSDEEVVNSPIDVTISTDESSLDELISKLEDCQRFISSLANTPIDVTISGGELMRGKQQQAVKRPMVQQELDVSEGEDSKRVISSLVNTPIDVTISGVKLMRGKQQQAVKRPMVQQELDVSEGENSKRVKYESDGGGSPISGTVSGGELIRSRSSSPSSSTTPANSQNRGGGCYVLFIGLTEEEEAPRPTAVVPANNSKRVPRNPKCARCHNHNITVTVKGHNRNCPFRTCRCNSCSLIGQRQSVMARQVALRRELEQFDGLMQSFLAEYDEIVAEFIIPLPI